MNIFQKFRATLQLREAIRQAEEAHAADGNRYYVMPADNGKLVIMDRRNFRLLKRKHYVNANANCHNLMVESFYFTANRDGSGYLSEADRKYKVQQYFAWCDAERKRKK